MSIIDEFDLFGGEDIVVVDGTMVVHQIDGRGGRENGSQVGQSTTVY
jgi:hypothetical protein